MLSNEIHLLCTGTTKLVESLLVCYIQTGSAAHSRGPLSLRYFIGRVQVFLFYIHLHVFIGAFSQVGVGVVGPIRYLALHAPPRSWLQQ